MLWYKSWRETRMVTLGGVAAMAIACLMIVWFEQAMRNNAEVPLTYVAYIWKSVYKQQSGRDMYLFLCVILGGGSLLQERPRALRASRSRSPSAGDASCSGEPSWASPGCSHRLIR